jgi:small-conductance mechanosensitive channel
MKQITNTLAWYSGWSPATGDHSAAAQLYYEAQRLGAENERLSADVARLGEALDEAREQLEDVTNARNQARRALAKTRQDADAALSRLVERLDGLRALQHLPGTQRCDVPVCSPGEPCLCAELAVLASTIAFVELAAAVARKAVRPTTEAEKEESP